VTEANDSIAYDHRRLPLRTKCVISHDDHEMLVRVVQRLAPVRASLIHSIAVSAALVALMVITGAAFWSFVVAPIVWKLM
jgi:hypothetical protein